MKKTSLILVLIFSCFAFSMQAANTADPVNHNLSPVTVKNVTPLCLAIAKGDIDGVKKLIELGADVEKKSNGMKPIHFAARYNQVEIMKVLVEAGAKTKSRCDKGYTALKHAELSNADAVTAYLKSID